MLSLVTAAREHGSVAGLVSYISHVGAVPVPTALTGRTSVKPYRARSSNQSLYYTHGCAKRKQESELRKRDLYWTALRPAEILQAADDRVPRLSVAYL